MKKFFTLIAAVITAMVVNAASFVGFDAGANLGEQIADGLAKDLVNVEFIETSAGKYSVNLITGGSEASFKFGGVQFAYTNSADGATAFKTYGTYIQPNGKDREIRIPAKAGEKVRVVLLDACAGVLVDGELQDFAAGENILTASKEDIVLKTVSTKPKIQAIEPIGGSVEPGDDHVSGSFKGFSAESQALGEQIADGLAKDLVNVEFVETSAGKYSVNLVTGGEEGSFKFGGVQFAYTNSTEGATAFRTYVTYIQPNGKDREIRIPAKEGEKVRVVLVDACSGVLVNGESQDFAAGENILTAAKDGIVLKTVSTKPKIQAIEPVGGSVEPGDDPGDNPGDDPVAGPFEGFSAGTIVIHLGKQIQNGLIQNKVNIEVAEASDFDPENPKFEIKCVTGGVEGSFSMGGVVFAYTNSADGAIAFKTFGTYIAPNGTNREIRIPAKAGEKVRIVLKEACEGVLVNGVSQDFVAGENILTAAKDGIVLKNDIKKPKIQAIRPVGDGPSAGSFEGFSVEIENHLGKQIQNGLIQNKVNIEVVEASGFNPEDPQFEIKCGTAGVEGSFSMGGVVFAYTNYTDGPTAFMVYGTGITPNSKDCEIHIPVKAGEKVRVVLNNACAGILVDGESQNFVAGENILTAAKDGIVLKTGYKKPTIKAIQPAESGEEPGGDEPGSSIETQEEEVNIHYLDKEEGELHSELVTLHVPTAPEIEGFTFLRWDVVAGPLSEGIYLQAVYEYKGSTTSAPSEVVNPANKAQKLIRNGNVYILTSDHIFDTQGKMVR